MNNIEYSGNSAYPLTKIILISLQYSLYNISKIKLKRNIH